MGWLAIVRYIIIGEVLRQTIRELFRRGRYLKIGKTMNYLSSNSSKRMNTLDYYLAHKLVKYKDKLDSVYGGDGNYAMHPTIEFPIDTMEIPKITEFDIYDSKEGEHIGNVVVQNKKASYNVFGRSFVDIEVVKLVNVYSNVKKIINKRRSTSKNR